MELLKEFILERLKVAAHEIFGAVDKVVADFQGEMYRVMEENARLQKLDMSKRENTDSQGHCDEEDLSPGQQRRSSPGLVNPEPTLVKEEPNEFWASQEEELPGLDIDSQNFVPHLPCVRADFDSILPQDMYPSQSLEDREKIHWDSQLSKASVQIPMERKDYRGPGPSHHDSLLLSVVNPDRTERVDGYGLPPPVTVSLNPYTTKGSRTQRMFKCEVCGKCFTWKNVLSRHMVIHTGVKPFKCKECGKCFNLKHNLTIHMMIHTGDKPYECLECGKCFNRASVLSRHMIVHAGDKTRQGTHPSIQFPNVNVSNKSMQFGFPRQLPFPLNFKS